MDRNAYTDADHGQPRVPPATRTVIDPNASAEDAATPAQDNGDSHAPGSQPAHFNRGRSADGGDRDFPGEQPDEIVPDQGDNEIPGQRPDEVSPDQGDFVHPDSSPIESPPQPDTAPSETPPPPD